MLLHNKTNTNYQHSYFDEKGQIVLITLNKGEVKEIDDKLAKKWLKIDGITEFVNPAEVKSEIEELKEKLAVAQKRAEESEQKLKAEKQKKKGK